MGILNVLNAFALASGGGGGPSSTDWRTLFTDNHGSATFIELAEVRFYDSLGSLISPTGATVLKSSEGGGAASNAFDGNTATSWASTSGSVTNQYLGLSWPTAKSVGSVGLRMAPGADLTRAPKNCLLQRWDGSTWQTEATFKFTYPLRDYERIFPEAAPPAGAYRAIRLFITSTVGGTQTQVVEREDRLTSGGADQTSPQTSNSGSATGRIIVSGEAAGNEGIKAFDGVLTTTTGWFVSSGSNTHITYVHPTPITIAEMTVLWSSTTNRSASALKVQGSNDQDAGFTDLKTLTGLAPGAGATTTISIP